MASSNKPFIASSGTSSSILATAGYDHTIKLWDALTGSCVGSLEHSKSQVNALAVSSKASGRQYMLAAGNPTIELYDLKSGNTKPLVSFEGHTSNITSIGFESSSEARWFFSASDDGSLRIWDTRAPPNKAVKMYEPKYHVGGVLATATGANASSAVGSAISPMNAAALHPNDAEIITGDQNGAICFWDLTSSSNVATSTYVPEQDVPIRSISVARDGSRVAVATSKGSLYSWTSVSTRTFGVSPAIDEKNTKPIYATPHDTYILKCCWSPNMKYLATASADHTIKILDASDLKTTLKVFNRHQRWVWDCAFTSDSSYLLSSSSDHSARLWSLSSLTTGQPPQGPSGDMVRIFMGHSKAVTAIALCDDSD